MVFIPHILSGILRVSPCGPASVRTIFDRFLWATPVKKGNLVNGESGILHFIPGIKLEAEYPKQIDQTVTESLGRRNGIVWRK